MSIHVQSADGVMAVSGEIGFENAGATLELGREAIAATSELRIDLAGLTRSNSAGLAVMIEWLAIARRQGHTVTFSGIPEGLHQLAQVCQVDGMLPTAASA